MGSYGAIKEALLVKKNGQTNEYTVVQKLVPSTVNGMVTDTLNDGGYFEYDGQGASVSSVYRGGAFGFSDDPGGDITVTVNIPGYGVKMFKGDADVQIVNGVGPGVLCTPSDSHPNAPYTNLCLVVESPVSVFPVKRTVGG